MHFAQSFALGSSARRHVAEQGTVELALNELLAVRCGVHGGLVTNGPSHGKVARRQFV